MPANLENLAVTTGLGKVNFHSNPKEGQCQRMFKLMHNCTHLTGSHSNAQNSPSEASKHLNCELPDVQKAEEPEMKSSTSTGSLKKQQSSRKTPTSDLLTMPKSLAVWITTHCRKFWNLWEYQTTLPTSWGICMQVKKQVRIRHGTMDQFPLGKEYCKAVYCHPTYLTYMQSTSCEMLDWMNHKLE